MDLQSEEAKRYTCPVCVCLSQSTPHLAWLTCLECSALCLCSSVLVPSVSAFMVLPPPPYTPHPGPPSPPYQEAAREAVLVLQSIFEGSDGVNVTPSPVRKAIQESKQEKPRLDCTYCTGKSGLNLWREEKRRRRNRG